MFKSVLKPAGSDSLSRGALCLYGRLANSAYLARPLHSRERVPLSRPELDYFDFILDSLSIVIDSLILLSHSPVVDCDKHRNPEIIPMTAKPWTFTEAANEVRYILSVNPAHPGQAFNWDPECFARYRRMQSNHAQQSGHDHQAAQMIMRGPWPQVSANVDTILHS